MRRTLVLALLVACSSSSSAKPEATGSAAPASAPVPTHVAQSTLDHAEALAYLPSDLEGVLVASSYQDLVAAFGAKALAALPVPPVGLARDRPIGIAWRDDGGPPIAFGTIVNEHALTAAVAAAKLGIRGSLAFISDDLRSVAFAPAKGNELRFATLPEFTASVAALHGGSLVAWWMAGAGAVGITKEAETLHVRTTGGIAVPKLEHDDPKDRAELLRFSGQHLDRAKEARFNATLAKADHAFAARDAARDAVVAELAKDLGLAGNAKPVDAKLAPTGGLQVWASHLADLWQAADVLAKAATAANVRASRAADGDDPNVDPRDAEARAMVEALTYDPTPGTTAGDMASRRPEADLGTQVVASPTVKLELGGDPDLHRYLEGKLSQVRGCYIEALAGSPALHTTIVVEVIALGDGKSEANAAGGDDALNRCIVRAVAAEASHAKKTERFTFHLAP